MTKCNPPMHEKETERRGVGKGRAVLLEVAGMVGCCGLVRKKYF